MAVHERMRGRLNKEKRTHGASASTFSHIPPPANRVTAECIKGTKEEDDTNIE